MEDEGESLSEPEVQDGVVGPDPQFLSYLGQSHTNLTP